MREIEIQAESQIQSQMSLMQEQHGDFDPLEFDRYTRFQELTRSLAEGINDVSTVQHSLLKNLDDADAALLAQARLSREVQQRLFSIRTVPFGSLSERLYRILRATAKELDKRANLEIHGAKVELDRSVLEKLVGPLEHLLRNALDHGIEARDARVKAGKLETGEISLTVRQVGNEVVIDLADDGAGVDFARVRERARSLGLVAADAEPTDAQLIECLFQPGFSTASKVTQISGRGIGMDVVRAEVAALGGRVEVATTPGKGTQVHADDAADAGGRAGGARARRRPAVGAARADGRAGAADQEPGAARPLHQAQGRLAGTRLPVPLPAAPAGRHRAQSGDAALQLGAAAAQRPDARGDPRRRDGRQRRKSSSRTSGRSSRACPGISGATVLGSGEIVLIINPVQLAGRADVPKFDPDNDERAVGDRPRAPRGARCRRSRW